MFQSEKYIPIATPSIRARKAGFTLIEMMVSVAIVALISGVIIFQYTKFDSQLLLRNLAYEIALEIREAQVLAVSVRGSGNNYSASYGVYIDLSGSGNNKEYLLFRDVNNNGEYESGETIIRRSTITRGSYISEMCSWTGVFQSSDCHNDNKLYITFKRPDPDARIRSNSGAGTDAEIHIKGRNNDSTMRKVVITSTGQISVK